MANEFDKDNSDIAVLDDSVFLDDSFWIIALLMLCAFNSNDNYGGKEENESVSGV